MSYISKDKFYSGKKCSKISKVQYQVHLYFNFRVNCVRRVKWRRRLKTNMSRYTSTKWYIAVVALVSIHPPISLYKKELIALMSNIWVTVTLISSTDDK